MTAILIFIGFLVALVAFAVVRAKASGVSGLLLEDWKPDEGETIVFEDRAVRLLLTPHMGEGSDLRPGAFIVVTNKRMLAGQRPLFGRGSMVGFMIYVGRAPGTDADGVTGGLFQRGYKTLVVEPVVERVVDGKKPYVELTPSPSAASSFNLKAFRIYTGRAREFPALPGPA